jgi:hypothetical protein
MNTLLPLAEKIAAMLKQRRENIAVAESTTGGLVSAALLSVPGASTYFVGGAVVYTLKARRAMLDLPDSAFAGIKSVTERRSDDSCASRTHSIRSHLEHRRDRRKRSHRQSLRRSRRPQLYRDRGPDREIADSRDWEPRPHRQHAHILSRRVESAPSMPKLTPLSLAR